MTTRNLDALFAPKAIAVIGASNRTGSVGSVLARNLFECGFNGPILSVNPREQAVHSTLNYRSVADLPLAPDLAVLATPPATVPGLVAELGQRGCRAAIVITAGFGEGDRMEGRALRQAMLDAARPHLLRIVGPNCLGFISTARGINASFAHLMPPTGDVAFVTQSGAIATAVLDWASARGFGFSHMVSLGDMADIDFGDLLDYLALDPGTRAILLYVENITAARKFMSAARIAARAKPVIVIKAGRSEAGAAAAMSHTGALAGADHVYDAAFRRAGMLRVFELRELFEAVTTLSSGMSAVGDRLTVLTNGGGAGVLAADALEAHGGHLARLSRTTMERLDAVLPPTWSHGNPVDMIGDAGGERYAKAMEIVLGELESDAVLAMNCPTAVVDSLEAARAVVAARKPGRKVPVLSCWLGETSAMASRQLFARSGIPTYETPAEAVRAFMHLVDYRRNQDLLLETPAAADIAPDRDGVRAIVRAALGEGRTTLTEPESKSVLTAYGIPTVPTRVAATPALARMAAEEIDVPVVLKIFSPDITHKSDVGGVALDLATPEAVEVAALAMLERIRERSPNARVAGFTVQPMVLRPMAEELLLGIADDPTFGPVILFGQGGTAAEVIADRAVGLPPLNSVLAAEMIARTRITRLLAGYRDHPPADRGAIVDVLIRLSQLAADIDEIVELDINPLLADADGVIALDARVALRPTPRPGADRLAIRPYPRELTHEEALPDGSRTIIRPIRPDDEPRLDRMIARSATEDFRPSFLGPVGALPARLAARLSQIDYAREMAFVAVDPVDGALTGIARLVATPGNESAEVGVMVRTDRRGRGIGYRLLGELIGYARNQGIGSLFGDVLRGNETMLAMATEFGFRQDQTSDPDVLRVTLGL